VKLRAAAAGPPDLSAETIAILLGGWGAEPPAAADDGDRGFEHGFADLYEQDGPATLWRTHEAFLRATAVAWGWVPTFLGPDGVARFWGEHDAAGYVVRRG
jgi:hypothetical protein